MASTSEPVRRRALTVLLAAAALTGCERVVRVTAPASEARLVVEARLERARGSFGADQRIRLTTTEDAFASSNVAPAVVGATVRVVDANGTTFAFTESTTEPGSYTFRNMRLVTGRRYTLQVTWDGDTYTATETMLPAVPLDSIYFRIGEGPPGRPVGLSAAILTRDPDIERNFYLWDQWVDGRRQVSPDSTTFTRAVLSDDIINGAIIKDYTPYGGIIVEPGQLVRMRQLAISEQAYRFYNSLSQQTSNNGSPFGVPAGSVRGNVANTTRPARLALGYFIAGEYSERELRVPGAATP